MTTGCGISCAAPASDHCLPDGLAKRRILRAIDQARVHFVAGAPAISRAVAEAAPCLASAQTACALDDQSSCPRTAPHHLTTAEIRAIKAMVTSPEYRHVPTGTLSVLARRLGKVWPSPSTWYSLG